MASAQDADMEVYLDAQIAALVEDFAEAAEQNGTTTKWRYMNYVNPEQDPLRSYGDANVQFMKDVAAKYDPQLFFQARVSGGFKISRVQ